MPLDSVPSVGAPVLLMCPPTYYNIEYKINHWMDLQHPADPAEAHRQWTGLHDMLVQRCGCRVEIVEPVTGLPDMVFTANAGLVYGDVVILSNFRHNERKGEAEHMARWFQQYGLEVRMLPGSYSFEGEGDALFHDDVLYAGYRYRTDVHTHRMIGEMLGVKVLSMNLIDPRFYHLDTCFCPLGRGVAAYVPCAFDDYAKKTLAAHIPKLIEINDHDAVNFAANTVVIGGSAVINRRCDTFARTLEAAGFQVHETPLTQFLLAGGSAKCLTLYLKKVLRTEC